ncbi:hypothetical protein [Nocardioides sp.]|uniref:hypothetical protein n=1 Tax=Nocardioides sp. TaxID=35761 RepID=UPI002B279242|nr:hypothetical protein [Nocardioides sp.]
MVRSVHLEHRRVLPVLTVLVLLGSALSLVLALTRPNPQPPQDLPGAATGSAYVPPELEGPGGPGVLAIAEAIPTVLGYDHRRLDEGLREATALMTKPFARRFRGAFNSSARPLALRQLRVVDAEVRGIGQVRVIDATTVLALAYVNQLLVSSRTQPSPEEPTVLSRYRILVRATVVGTEWRVTNISPV